MARAKLPLGPAAVWSLARELRAEQVGERPLAVAGARELADALRRELGRGGEAALTDAARVADAAALVYVLAAPPTEEDERVLRAADRAGIPIVCLVPEELASEPLPFVLATDVVPLRPGSGFPLDELARLLARKLGQAGAPLAARLPVLRPAVCAGLIESAARKNALVGAAVFVPGADYPVLTLTQLRLVLRLAQAYGQELDRERLPEVLAVVGGGLGFRALARELLGAVPVAGWALKGGVAYLGTRAIGEAAMRYFEARQPDRP